MAKLEQPIYAPQSIDFLDETFQTDSEAETANVFQNAALEPAGIPIVLPAYMNTAGDYGFQMTSANHKIALLFTPEGDFDLIGQGISALLKANATPGLVPLGLYDVDGTSVEPNGGYNGNPTSCSPTMTANNAPSPYVVWLVDKNAANAEAGAGYEAFKASDGVTATADNGTRSNATPTSGDPIYWGIDFGEGVTKIVNKVVINSVNNASADVRAFPKSLTFWGSNAANPTKNTDGDWTALTTHFTHNQETDPGAGVAASFYLINSTGYRHIRIKITDRNGSNAYTCLGEVTFYEAVSQECPGTLLASFGTQDSTGISAGNWLRKLIATSYQIQRRKRLALVMSGAAAKDFTASLNRRTNAVRTAFPDNCKCLTTTDGTTWTEPYYNPGPSVGYNYMMPLMWNVVVGSSTNHAPQVAYVQNRGPNIFLPEDGIMTIQRAGAWLNCEDLTANTLHYLYAYNNAGTLAIEASTTKRTIHPTAGFEVKLGATDRRFIGILYPVTRVSTKSGPYDVLDARLLNYEGFDKSLGKICGYYASGHFEAKNAAGKWIICGQAAITDYKVEFVALGETCVTMYFNLSYNASSNRAQVSIGLDGDKPWCYACSTPSVGGNGSEMGTEGKGNVEEGYHYFVPLLKATALLASSDVRYLNFGHGFLAKSNMSGKLECKEH